MGGVSVALTDRELEILGTCPLLRGVSPQLLRQAARAGTRAEYSAGETVYCPDHFLRSLGVLLSGQLQVTKGTLSVSRLEPGDLFGAAALYSDTPEFATTITARRPSRCLLLGQQLVDDLLAEDALVRNNYLRYLTGRIRFLSARLQSLSQHTVEGKLARYLLTNQREQVLVCPATELAGRLGVSRASLYRAFQTLEDAGLILRRGQAIQIPSLTALEGVL